MELRSLIRQVSTVEKKNELLTQPKSDTAARRNLAEQERGGGGRAWPGGSLVRTADFGAGFLSPVWLGLKNA